MNNDSKFIKNFWNEKILGWENKRYQSGVILIRLQETVRLIQEINKDKDKNFTILELGCGSGHLAKMIQEEMPNVKYLGIDISDKAIEKACNENIKNSKFICGDVGNPINETFENIDCVISLGLLDWLNDYERDKIQAIKSKYFIHAFSTKKSIVTLLHRLFVLITYGYKKISYLPRYDDTNTMLKKWGGKRIIESSKLNIAKIMVNWDE